MRILVALTLLLATGVLKAEEWVIIPDPTSLGPSGGGPIVSLDTQSIELLDSGLRRARTQFDFSLLPRDASESSQKSLNVLVMVELYDCKKRSTQMETSEAHLADGSVKYAKAKNTGVWLRAEVDPVRDFVCAWKPK
jgi:hypothetical protein